MTPYRVPLPRPHPEDADVVALRILRLWRRRAIRFARLAAIAPATLVALVALWFYVAARYHRFTAENDLTPNVLAPEESSFVVRQPMSVKKIAWVPRMDFGHVRVSGAGLRSWRVDTCLIGRFRDIATCYANELLDNPNLRGEVEVRFDIDEDGTPRRETARFVADESRGPTMSADWGGEAIATCARNTVHQRTFPPPAGAVAARWRIALCGSEQHRTGECQASQFW